MIRPTAAFATVFEFIEKRGVYLTSDETLDELFQVLSREKFRKYIPLDQSIDYVEWNAALSERIRIVEHIVACRDPRDDCFPFLAVAGEADCIVAGDRHLLEMIQLRGIPIYRPADFVRLVIR